MSNKGDVTKGDKKLYFYIEVWCKIHLKHENEDVRMVNYFKIDLKNLLFKINFFLAITTIWGTREQMMQSVLTFLFQSNRAFITHLWIILQHDYNYKSYKYW